VDLRPVFLKLVYKNEFIFFIIEMILKNWSWKTNVFSRKWKYSKQELNSETCRYILYESCVYNIWHVLVVSKGTGHWGVAPKRNVFFGKMFAALTIKSNFYPTSNINTYPCEPCPIAKWIPTTGYKSVSHISFTTSVRWVW
jgi:hypothetical protein